MSQSSLDGSQTNLNDSTSTRKFKFQNNQSQNLYGLDFTYSPPPVQQIQEAAVIPTPPTPPPVIKEAQKIDYSSSFPDIESLPQTSIFIISQMEPVYQPENTGTFCINDCYLILSKQPLDEAIIHIWIGTFSEMDKRFCAAMFAVNLRSLFTKGKIYRQEQDDESDDFLDLFETVYDTGVGTESALYSPGLVSFPTRLYFYDGNVPVLVYFF